MAIDALMGTFCDVDDVRLRKASARAELEAAASKPGANAASAEPAQPAASSSAAASDAATRRRTAAK